MAGMDPFSIIEGITGLIGVYEQSQFNERERQDAIKRRETMRGMSTGLKGRVLPSIDKLGKEQMRMLEGSGVQQKKDIRRRTGERLDQTLSNVNRRGLGNTTIAGSMRKGFGDFEEDQLARVDETVRQERMQTAGYWGLLGNTMDVDLTGQQINIEAGGAIPAQQSMFLPLSELAGRFVPPPEAPEPPGTDYGGIFAQGAVSAGTIGLMGGFGGGGGGAALLTGKAMAMVCIDGDAMLETVAGQVSLADVRIGEEVTSADARLKKVVGKDYGLPHALRQDDFVTIDAQGRTLTLTVDHIVSGKPAGDWKAGDVMDRLGRISSITKAEPVHCGDILLEDGSDYIANGFRVATTPALVAARRKELCHN